MGCVSSKQGVSVTPVAIDSSGALNAASFSGQRSRLGSDKSSSGRSKAAASASTIGAGIVESVAESDISTATTCGSESVSFTLGNLHLEGEQIAAGWPAWLSAVAGEAIQGWIPLCPDSFEKLEKIGQGTYSSVFRARDLDTGKIVALKKVQFDNFEPESVRFMAREILILRRLDHPNVIKLEGIITSKLSSSIYLVFEYMEHDLSGLSSCPEIKFTESQVKCYMKQLLAGLEHCHTRGIMHRDIKGSNLLVNNEGILKVADFGLANFSSLVKKQPLTSRVVTLWYRPPELLLGATEYRPSVDLWSAGCVLAEVLLGRPLLQGRTEVEQLHKIFKLCGSPPDEYWNKSRLPHATLIKPQQRYVSCLRESCKDLPRPAVNLIEALLSVEPSKRGTASSALSSEYFAIKPYACDPSSLPKYPPNKEIDAKCREEARKKKLGGRACSRGRDTSRKASRKPSGVRKLASAENLPVQTQNTQRTKINGKIPLFPPEEENIFGREDPKLSVDQKEVSHSHNASHDDVPYSGPLPVSGSSGFAWAKKRRNDASARSYSRSSSKTSLNGLEQPPSSTSLVRKNLELRKDSRNVSHGSRPHSLGRDHVYCEADKPAVQRQWSQMNHLDSFDDYRRELEAKRNKMGQDDMDEFSGPLMSQSHRIEELLEKHERRICQAARRSWFQQGNKNWK